MKKTNPTYLLLSFLSGFLLVALIMRLLMEEKSGDAGKRRLHIGKSKKRRGLNLGTISSRSKPVQKNNRIARKKTVATDKDARIQKILSLLKRKKQLSISELHKMFQDVSSRTLRRDLGTLEKQNLIQRRGRARATVYQYRGA